jgi:hypothetical protein
MYSIGRHLQGIVANGHNTFSSVASQAAFPQAQALRRDEQGNNEAVMARALEPTRV